VGVRCPPFFDQTLFFTVRVVILVQFTDPLDFSEALERTSYIHSELQLAMATSLLRSWFAGPDI